MHGKEFGGHLQSVELWRGRNSCGLISPNKLIKKDQPKFGMVKMGWVKKAKIFGLAGLIENRENIISK